MKLELAMIASCAFAVAGCSCGIAHPGFRPPQGEGLAVPDNEMQPGAIVVRGYRGTGPQIICSHTEFVGNGPTQGKWGAPAQFELSAEMRREALSRLGGNVQSVVHADAELKRDVVVTTTLGLAERTPLVGVPAYDSLSENCKQQIRNARISSPGVGFAYVYASMKAVVEHHVATKENASVSAEVAVQKVNAALTGAYAIVDESKLVTTTPQVVGYEWAIFAVPKD